MRQLSLIYAKRKQSQKTLKIVQVKKWSINLLKKFLKKESYIALSYHASEGTDPREHIT